MDLYEIFEKSCQIVKRAGSQIRFAKPQKDVKEKTGAFNFVTKYDSMVQEFLVRELGSLIPEAVFVGEEDGCDKEKISDGYTFILDPIDGTTNFICGFPCCGISAALALHGTVQFGIVYNPFRDELFSAFRGNGAFLNGERLFVDEKGLRDGLGCIDISPYDLTLRETAFQMAQKLSYCCMDIRDVGSAALAICYVAAGRCVSYYSLKLCVWDYAAAGLILEEAGGKIAKTDGTPLNLETGISLLAGTKIAFSEMKQLFDQL